MNKDEKRLWTVVKVFVIIVGVLFIYHGFLHKPTPPEGTLWDALHPASFVNWIGVIMWIACMVGISGSFVPKLNDTFEDVGRWFPYVVFAVGILGIVLMFA